MERVFIQKNYHGLIMLALLLSIIPIGLHAAEKMNLRGQRYCEIIVAKSLTNYSVYNTWGLNDCPAALWNQVNVAQVKQETGSSFVHLNGPRHWVIDGFKKTALINPSIKTLAGLTLREAGILHLSVFDLLKPNTPYQDRNVNRQTTWIYQSGRPVYELINPKGQVFVMQSFSVQQHPQTEQSLSQLGSVLTLPAGWKFKTGILKQPEMLEAINNRAVVAQDNYLNTYQMATHDFLIDKS